MQKEDKELVVAELTERLRTAETLFVADYRGLTMPQIDALRGKLLEHGAKFTVVKNTLTRRAAEAAGADALLAMLEGPSAVAFIEATATWSRSRRRSPTRPARRRCSRSAAASCRAADLGRRGRRAREAAAVRRAPRSGARCDHRAADLDPRARERAAPELGRSDRRPHRAARRRSGSARRTRACCGSRSCRS